jgi:hypothetical protein
MVMADPGAAPVVAAETEFWRTAIKSEDPEVLWKCAALMGAIARAEDDGCREVDWLGPMVDGLGETIVPRLDGELSFARLAPLHDILARLAELQHRTMGSDALGVTCAELSERLLGQGDAPFG